MGTTVQLDLGGSTLNLNDGSNYALLAGQQPQTTVRRASRLGGGLPYVELQTTVPLRVFGSTPAAALAALADLQQIDQQVADWKDGEPEDPVIYIYAPDGSALAAPPRAVVLGPHRPGDPLVVLPRTFNKYIVGSEINPVYLQLRHGALLGAEESKSSSAVANPGVMSVATFTDHDGVASVYDLRLAGFTDSTVSGSIGAGLLMLANASNRLVVIEAEGGASGADAEWSSTGVTSASGGNVLRFTAADTDPSSTGFYNLSTAGFDTSLEHVAVAVRVMNNSASKTFFLRFRASTYSGDEIVSVTRKIDPDTYSLPRSLFLGYATVRDGVGYLRLEAWVDDAAGSPTMDIDVLAVMDGGRNGHVIKHNSIDLSSPFGPGVTPVNYDLLVEHRLLEERDSYVGVEEDVAFKQKAASYRGALPIVMTGNDASCLWLGGPSWRLGGSSPVSLTATLTRRAIYTVPQ